MSDSKGQSSVASITPTPSGQQQLGVPGPGRWGKGGGDLWRIEFVACGQCHSLQNRPSGSGFAQGCISTLFRNSPQTHESDIIFHQPPPSSLHIRFKLGVREVISSRSLRWSVERDCGFGFRLPILQSSFILLYPLSLSNAGVRPLSPAGEQRCQATWLLASSVFGSLKSTVSRYECGF